MKFQPGEPGSTAKSLDQVASLLVYISGNNLVLCENGQLVQTLYLPADGVALAIERGSLRAAVLLGAEIVVFEPQESYLKGRSWILAHTLTVGFTPENLAWFDGYLLICGSRIELVAVDGLSVWTQPNCSASQLAVAPDAQYFVSMNESSHLKLWSRVSSSVLAFDIDYLRLPYAPQWVQWSGDCLFAWCNDRVLRGFRQIGSASRYELFVNLELESAPGILSVDQKLYLISLGAKYTLWRLDIDRTIVQPVNVFTTMADLDVSTKDSDLIHVYLDKATLKLTQHKPGHLILASAPEFFNVDGTPSLSIEAVLTGHSKSIQSVSRGSMGDLLLTTSRFDENFIWKPLKLPSGEITIEKFSSVKLRGIDQSDLKDKHLLTLSGVMLQLWDIGVTASLRESVELSQKPLVVGFAPSGIVVVFADKVQSLDLKLKVQSSYTLEAESAVLVDPVGSNSANRDVFTTVGPTEIITWARDGSQWKQTSVFDRKLLGKEPITAVQMSLKKLAIALGDRLVIWSADTNIIELDLRGDAITDLDWTATPTGGCLLGVGYAERVVIYSQQRYDYTKQLEAWRAIREISISKYTTHKIGDSIWLKDGTFVIGAGNQLFIQSSAVDMKDTAVREMFRKHNTISSLETSSTLFDINAVLNGPLPIYHPQFLIQLIYSGRLELAKGILCRLLEALKYTAAVDSLVELDRYLDCTIHDLAAERESRYAQAAQDLEHHLSTKTLSYLTQHQQVTLLSIVQSVAQIDESLDAGASLYMLGYHLFRIHAEQPQMNIRDFVWASTSNTKQILLDEVERNGALAKMDKFIAFGLPFWLESNALAEKSELLAKRMFAVGRDPVQVTLIYLALRKKQLLIGLWRVSSSHPEQAKTLKLLNNDYQQPRWKEAALKNAYALMSKHRYEYAAALFLLGDAVKDACNVLARQLQNLPLAVMVARLYDGDDGIAMHYLRERFIEEPWSSVWVNLMLGDNKAAVLAATVRVPEAQRSITDPVLVWIYQQLKAKCALTAAEEMQLLARTSKMYCRMGCDLVALEMCKEWHFSSSVTRDAEPEQQRTSPSAPPAFSVPTSSAPAAPSAPALSAPPENLEFDPSAFGF